MFAGVSAKKRTAEKKKKNEESDSGSDCDGKQARY
jgi:hypothetical protein